MRCIRAHGARNRKENEGGPTLQLFGGSGGEFGAGAGQRHRVSAVILDGTLVLVLAIAPEAPFEPAFARAETVISTIDT